jgi:hypothetical protein
MTMTCSDFEKQILMEGSGEVSASLRPRLAGHLEQCPQCRAFRADFQVLSTLSRAGLADLPEGPSAPVLEHIRIAAGAHRLKQNHFRPRLTRLVLAMAAGLLVLIGAWHVTTRTPAQLAPADSRTARIAEWSSLLATLMETEDPAAGSEDVTRAYSDLQSLARQLLILQDMSVELPDDLADGTTPAEEHQPTTLRWRNTHAAIFQTCG